VIALVDESIVLPGGGCYVLAGVVLPSARKAAVRRAARRLTRPGHARFHWKDEERQDRMAMLDLLVDHAAALHAYASQPAARRDHEVIRARLLTELLTDLPRGVLDLLIESRQPHNDRADRQVIAAAQRSGGASPDLDYHHARPLSEPLLWLPDALAGAVMARVRKEGQYLERLAGARLILQGP
jgi:hypothetical protein